MLPGVEVVHGALERPRLAALLGQRWSRYVVSLVAGAGFGKSTAIAQATRLVGAHDRHDHVLVCDPSWAAESEVVRQVAAAFGVHATDVHGVARAALALDGTHCLVLDDVHRVDDTSAGAAALGDLVERLVPGVHVVAASRRPLPFRLARWRAAGQVLVVGEPDLAFDEDELAALAARAGTDFEALIPTGGWPALAALSAIAGRQGAIEYLAEEVIDRLEPKCAEALEIAVLAGTANPEMLERVAGASIGPTELAHAVPMLTVDAAGAVTPHDLWTTVVEPRILPERRKRMLAAIAQHHRERGDHRAALRAGTRANDALALADVVRDIGQLGHIAFDLDEIEHWVGRAPDAFGATAEGRLLLAIAARGRDLFADATVALLAASWQELRQLSVVGCEIVALTELAFVHRARGEPDQMLPMVARLLELDAAGFAECRPFATFARAGVAEQLGDVDAALAALESLHEGDLSDGWMALVEFQRCNHLLLLGRPREAFEAARRATALGRGGYLGGWCAELSAMWFLGASRELLERLPLADELPNSSQLDRIWVGTWFGAIQASAGQLDRAARNIAVARAALRSHSQPEFVGFLAWAEAAYAVADHADERARDKLRAFVATHPLETPTGLRLAARAPALFALLLGDSTRDQLRAQLGGAWQQTALDVADALADLRAGRQPAALTRPELVLGALPLPWAVELAVLAAPHEPAWAQRLAALLGEVCGPALDAELQVLDVESPVEDLFRGGSASPTTVRLLGDVAVHGASLIEADQLRRRKVRELLAAIALEGPIGREALAERVWPRLNGERSANNLRVTLAYLRRVRRPDGSALVAEQAGKLALADGVATDYGEFDRLVQDAETARRAGAPHAAVGLYGRAMALVSGPPLAGIATERWFADAADRIGLSIASVGVRAARLAGELGEHAQAATAAAVAVDADPYREEAHGLLIAALLESDDTVAAEQAAVKAAAALTEVGVELEPRTAALIERAAPSGAPANQR